VTLDGREYETVHPRERGERDMLRMVVGGERGYHVLLGEGDFPEPELIPSCPQLLPDAPAAVRPGRPPAAVPATPLAGRTLALDVEDADGLRRVNLPGVIPGRRYVVGKDPECDIVVKGTFASRRHCEIWMDRNAWWVTDCGSTNGVRVEQAVVGVLRRAPMLASAGGDGKALEVAPGAHIVLSAIWRVRRPRSTPCSLIPRSRRCRSSARHRSRNTSIRRAPGTANACRRSAARRIIWS
jgi:hypothetical protein